MRILITIATFSIFFQGVNAQNAPGVKHPFVSNPNSKQLISDKLLVDYFYSWQEKYLIKTGDQAYINNDEKDEKGITTSEATGYGMMIEAYMAGIESRAKSNFDALYNYAKKHPVVGSGTQDNLSPYLMSWKQYKKKKDKDEDDSAVDGDLDIAYALLLAQDQWGSESDTSYRHNARLTLRAIKAMEMDTVNFRIIRGNKNGHGTDYLSKSAIRISDFMPDHFRAFFACTNDPFWKKLITVNYKRYVTAQIQFSHDFGLFPEYILVDPNENLSLVPDSIGYETSKSEGFNDGGKKKNPYGQLFAFNSCRVPWRLAIDYQLNNDKTALSMLQKFNQGMRKYADSNVCRLTNIYPLNFQHGINHAELIKKLADDESADLNIIAPLCAAISIEKRSTWSDNLQHRLLDDPKYPCDTDPKPKHKKPRNYYENTLRILCMFTIAGKLWQPFVK